MLDPAILHPAYAMVALTLLVWVRMYVERLGQMKRERIHPQQVASAREMQARISDTRAVDNFRNLFELPVLFYVALLVAALQGLSTPLSVGLAWAFVALRVVHSGIHCTYNRVMHRFVAYLSSCVVLWALWGYLALYTFA